MNTINNRGILGTSNQEVLKLLALCDSCDARLTKRSGYTMTDTRRALENLMQFGSVEVGRRHSCGRTDPTMYIYREWQKVLKAASKAGICISAESVKHGNAYATSKGGFWASEIYTVKSI